MVKKIIQKSLLNTSKAFCFALFFYPFSFIVSAQVAKEKANKPIQHSDKNQIMKIALSAITRQNKAMHADLRSSIDYFSSQFNALTAEEQNNLRKAIENQLKKEKQFIESYYELIERIGQKSDNPDYIAKFPYPIFKSGSKINNNIQIAIDLLREHPYVLSGNMPPEIKISTENCSFGDANILCKPTFNGLSTLFVVASYTLNQEPLSEEKVSQSSIFDSFLIFTLNTYEKLKTEKKIYKNEESAIQNSLFIKKINDNIILSVPHNGYLFGGNKKTYHNLPSNNKNYIAEDCSSFIFKIITQDDNFLNGKEYTGFFYFLHWMNESIKNEKNNKHKTRDILNPETLPYYFKMQNFLKKNNYHLFEIQDLNEVRDGDVLIWRQFKDEQDTTGTQGHIGFVLKKDNAKEFSFISLRRDYDYYNENVTSFQQFINFFTSSSRQIDKYLQGKSGFIIETISTQKEAGFSYLIIRQQDKPQLNIYDMDYLRGVYNDKIKTPKEKISPQQ